MNILLNLDNKSCLLVEDKKIGTIKKHVFSSGSPSETPSGMFQTWEWKYTCASSLLLLSWTRHIRKHNSNKYTKEKSEMKADEWWSLSSQHVMTPASISKVLNLPPTVWLCYFSHCKREKDKKKIPWRWRSNLRRAGHSGMLLLEVRVMWVERDGLCTAIGGLHVDFCR